MATVLKATLEGWRRCTETLLAGDLVAFPTDTVYGLGADASNREAVARLFTAKGRPEDKPIPVLLSAEARLTLVARNVPREAALLAEALWPGALTLVLPKRADLPEHLGSADTIAVRVPAHADLCAMIDACGGAVAVTSANRSGEPDARTADDVIQQLGESVSLIIDGGMTASAVPSTVVDCTGSRFCILREGRYSAQDIAAVLGDSVD